MKSKYAVSLTFLGGAVGWEAAKAVLIPLAVWSGTAVGGAAYVHWVIKSHDANVRRLNGEVIGEPVDPAIDADQILNDLNAMIATREIYIDTYRSNAANGAYVISKIGALRSEDALVKVKAEQLRQHAPRAYTSDIAARVEQLSKLDRLLEAISVKPADKNPS